MNEGTMSKHYIFLIALCLSKSSIASDVDNQDVVSYDGFSVMEASELTEEKYKRLTNFLEDNTDIIRLHQDRANKALQLAVPKEKQQLTKDMLASINSIVTTKIQDLGRLIPRSYGSLRVEPLSTGQLTFDHYMNMEEINAYVETLQDRYPQEVSRKVIGKTHEKNNINMLIITNKNYGGKKKPIVFIDGGIHAREWISPASVLYVVKTLLESPALINNLEWRIIPLLNPDGYKYSWTTDRLWRKNRSKNPGSKCDGTDLNRNFDFHWMEVGASNKPCSEVYAGVCGFSEPESIALRDAVNHVKKRVKAYITVHSYGQMILHPWGYSSTVKHPDSLTLKKLGNEMADAILKKTGSIFKVLSAGGLYAAAGSSDDYMSGGANIPISYTFELRDTGYNGFILPDNIIRPSGEELWTGIKILGRNLLREYGPPAYRSNAGELEEHNQGVVMNDQNILEKEQDVVENKQKVPEKEGVVENSQDVSEKKDEVGENEQQKQPNTNENTLSNNQQSQDQIIEEVPSIDEEQKSMLLPMLSHNPLFHPNVYIPTPINYYQVPHIVVPGASWTVRRK